MSQFPSPFDIGPISNALRERPLIFADVGAAGGIDRFLRRFDDGDRIRYFGFEPNPHEFEKLRSSTNIQYFACALSDHIGETQFFLDGTASSIEPKNFAPPSTRSIKVPLRTLAQLIEEGSLPGLDAVKVDAEGHDLHVLRGIGHRLSSDILLVKTEFSFRPHLAGSYFSEIDKLLTTSGLVLFGMQYNCSPLGEFNGGDALYLRSVASITDADAPAHLKRERVLKLIALCHYIHNFDYAYTVARTARDHGILSLEDSDPIEAALQWSFYLPSIYRGSEWTDPIIQICFAGLSVLAGARWRNKSIPKPNRIDRSGFLSIKTPRLLQRWLRRHLEIINRDYKSQKSAYSRINSNAQTPQQ